MTEKKKVLFMVYRTEWWGCFDSYCRQECSREDTECYVMPVPRFERDLLTSEVNFEKRHFDPEKLAPMLPEGVCMVNHEEFPLEQGFDRIYIHNPYDNCSLLDTVEWKYYSSNLKQYTERLIYVSHLLGLPLSNYTICAAYDYVDAIYVPNAGAKYVLEAKYDGKTEIMPSGIPEYLDFLTDKRGAGEDAKGGDSAEDRMKLLYCVSFDDLFRGTERQLQEMREIFEYARQNRNILLIFRPDEDIPVLRLQQQLSDAIWQGYEELVAFFVKNRIGIYDSTPNLYEAAAMADGILCTAHPLSALFSVQGKYVLHLDRVHRLAPTTEARCIPALWAVAVEEKEDEIQLWFVPEKTNLICRMTIPGGGDVNVTAGVHKRNDRKKTRKHLAGPKVDIIAEVPDEMIGGLNYINLTKRGDCLYLSPFASDGIWKYDMKSEIFTKQYLPDAVDACVGATFVHGKYLYMIPRMYPGIVKYDMETEETIVINGWVDELERQVQKGCEKEPYFIWAAKQEGDMLYLASSKCDVWIEFDMDDDSWHLRSMGLPGKKFVHMVKDEEWVWLLSLCGGEIILWNCRTGESQLVHKTLNCEIRNISYSFGMDMGDCFAVFPQQKTDHVLVIEKPYILTGRAYQGGKRDATDSSIAGKKSVARMKITEVRGKVPCGYEANQTEYQKQRNLGYQFVKQMASGMILTYEYYDGSFLLLDSNLQVVRKVPCRLPIEAVRQQSDLMWKYDQCRGRFHGGIHEGWSIPLMMEYFLRHGREDREEIRGHYERCFRWGAISETCAD